MKGIVKYFHKTDFLTNWKGKLGLTVNACTWELEAEGS